MAGVLGKKSSESGVSSDSRSKLCVGLSILAAKSTEIRLTIPNAPPALIAFSFGAKKPAALRHFVSD